MALEFREDAFEDAKMVREKVFMEEQGFQDEFDAVDEDPRCIPVTAYEDGQLIGCARVFPFEVGTAAAALPEEADTSTPQGVWIFGRLAVLPEYRKGGRGSEILVRSEEAARCHGATSIHLHAQCNAMAFYEKAGYIPYGPIELDEHVEHRWMRKVL